MRRGRHTATYESYWGAVGIPEFRPPIRRQMFLAKRKKWAVKAAFAPCQQPSCVMMFCQQRMKVSHEIKNTHFWVCFAIHNCVLLCFS